VTKNIGFKNILEELFISDLPVLEYIKQVAEEKE
jgi:hypothetical protein